MNLYYCVVAVTYPDQSISNQVSRKKYNLYSSVIILIGLIIVENFISENVGT